MRSIQTAMAAGAAGIVAAGEALAAGVAAAGGAVVAVYAGVAVVLIGGVYYYVTMDAEPEASKPKVESFPEEQARAQSFTTPAHESRPTTRATPAHDQASSSSDKGFDTYEGPDARVFTSDRILLPGEGQYWVKLKGAQGWKNTRDGTYWNKDKLHKDHWDISDNKGKKVREVDFNGKEIWPNGPKNKNKKP